MLYHKHTIFNEYNMFFNNQDIEIDYYTIVNEYNMFFNNQEIEIDYSSYSLV
jgi:hypothetical protein